MNSEWKQYTLSQIGKIITGKTPPTNDKSNYHGDIPFLTPSDDLTGKYVLKTQRKLSSKGAEKVKNSILPSNTICVSCIGSDLGKVVITTASTVTNQQFNSIIVDTESFDVDFVYYALVLLGQKLNYLSKTSTAVPIVNKTMFSQQTISCPDLKTQRVIGRVLSILDNKIQTNNLLNDNLQQQAQAIFSVWLAEHNDGSNEVSLGEICNKITDGSHFSPKDDLTSTIPMFSVKDMGEFDFNFTSCKHISDTDYQKMIANDCVPRINDILVAKDGSYLKEIFICNEDRRLAILSSIAIFRPDTSRIYPEILLAFLKSPRVLQEVRDNYVSGSALPRIVLKDFKKLRLLLPNMAAQSEISDILSAIRGKIAVNEATSNRLSQLRDALLSKLLSGEIYIPDHPALNH